MLVLAAMVLAMCLVLFVLPPLVVRSDDGELPELVDPLD